MEFYCIFQIRNQIKIFVFKNKINQRLPKVQKVYNLTEFNLIYFQTFYSLFINFG